MIKKKNFNCVASYDKYNGYINFGYFSGWAVNLNRINDCWQFELKQTSYQNQRLIVRLEANKKIPAYFNEHKHPPVKIIARIAQDPQITDFLSLVIKPLQITKPSLLEIPTKENFLAIGERGEAHKLFNPYLSFTEFNNLSLADKSNMVTNFWNAAKIPDR